VRAKDFLDKRLGKAIPYGVDDLTCNNGWVSVGIDHDTAAFAVETIRSWWQEMGRRRYPRATELLITADGGGSNGSRSRLWKVCLQRRADDLGLKVSVCHFPPGTSKWNKIEHRMFCHITRNWRGRPLTSRAVVVNLIGSTRTEAGLEIHAELDEKEYATGIKVTDAELAEVRIEKNDFHGEWNDTIRPKPKRSS
jgi:Rhodopirellula transposase DDE domain